LLLELFQGINLCEISKALFNAWHSKMQRALERIMHHNSPAAKFILEFAGR